MQTHTQSSCVQMTLNLLVKMRNRSSQNVIFTPNAPYIALTCSVHGGIKKVLPLHIWLMIWPKVNTDPITECRELRCCWHRFKSNPLWLPHQSLASPMGLCQWGSCASWKAEIPPCWVKIWGLLESMEADGSSSISKVLWSVLVCLDVGVKEAMEEPLSLPRNLGGVGMSRLFSFLALLYTCIPCSVLSAVCIDRYFQRHKRASFLMEEWETPQHKRKSHVVW